MIVSLHREDLLDSHHPIGCSRLHFGIAASDGDSLSSLTPLDLSVDIVLQLFSHREKEWKMESTCYYKMSTTQWNVSGFNSKCGFRTGSPKQLGARMLHRRVFFLLLFFLSTYLPAKVFRRGLSVWPVTIVCAFEEAWENLRCCISYGQEVSPSWEKSLLSTHVAILCKRAKSSYSGMCHAAELCCIAVFG